jgi:hypothetical protein
MDRFNGSEYVPLRDDIRLTGQLMRIWNLVCDGGLWTISRIAKLTGDPENSVQAQLRHLRKARFGAHTVDKVRVGNKGGNLWAYRVTPNQTQLVR